MVAVLAAVTLGASSDAGYQIDLGHYFPSAAAEAQSRRALFAEAGTFVASETPRTGPALLAWLQRYDALLQLIGRNDVYLYLLAEEDDRDTADAKADDALGDVQDRLDARVVRAAQDLGYGKIVALTQSPSLDPYRYLLLSSLAEARHQLDPASARAVAAAIDPVLDANASSYKALRNSGEAIAAHRDAYAALLISIATGRNGIARLRGFADAVEASYFDKSLTPASVERTLQAVRHSTSYARYLAVARTAPEPAFSPPPFPVVAAVSTILAAEQPMGEAYAGAYAALLDPAQRRLEICSDPHCDPGGFSVGASGSESGVFYGAFDRTTNAVRALAHESGHAVHRQFMNLAQPIAAYNDGPHFMFESFAIFNELLLLDHLYETANGTRERAYYLNAFIDDAAFQVFRSAQETDLEQSIYRGVDDGTIRTCADLSRLSSAAFLRYDPSAGAGPDVALYWARDRLFYTDPLYDVNYLYAGLLALQYFSDYKRDPAAFSKRYVALLKNGFNDTPAALERKFLGVDLSNEAALVAGATALIDARTTSLANLYAGLSPTR